MISRVAAIWILLEVLIVKSSLVNIQFLTQIDIDSYGCDNNMLIEAEEGFKQLNQTVYYVQTGKIKEYISELKELYLLVKRELDEQRILSTLIYLNKNLTIQDILNLQIHQQIDNLKISDKEERKINYEILQQKIEILLEQLDEIEMEYQNIIDINFEEVISKIKIIRNKCYNELNSQQLSKVEQKDIFIEFPEQIQIDDDHDDINLIRQEFIMNKICVSGESSILDMSSSQTQVIDLKVNKLEGIIEYGYGYWIRWLTRWPEQQMKGISQPWYFISRLTKNDPYDNISMGDRILAIWLGQAGYTFVTNDVTQENPNLQKILPYQDIEGVWTYIHFSYKQGQAVGILRIEDETKIIVLDAIHEQPNFLRLIIGGQNLNQYPGFNGQISQPIFKLGDGSFVNTLDDFNIFVMACNLKPQPDCIDKNKLIQLTQGIKKYDISSQQQFYEYFNNEQQVFPTIYGIGGWYKWVEIVQESEHLAFRITINNQEINKKLEDLEELGDRTLTVLLNEKQQYTFSTYSYQNMYGIGQSNIIQFIEHKNKHTQWHYIQFQYNRDIRQAYGSIIFKNEKIELQFKNINHYLVPIFRIFIGKDQFYNGFNGYITDVNYITCQDLYNQQFNPSQTPELMNHLSISISYTSEYNCQISDHTIVDSAYDDIQSIAEVEVTQNMIEEYGYSFWLRYLTRYPKPMYQGKTQSQYFISRLTNNINYQDIDKGDRLLGIWQGQGFYTFFTNDYKTNNWNLNQQIKYDDIEGVWTLFQFSYSNTFNKAIGFIKYSDQESQYITFNTYHDETINYLKFIIGGSDLSLYPAINGQFTKATFKIGPTAFIDTIDKLNKFVLECNPQPQEFCNQQIQNIVIEDTLKFQQQQKDQIPEIQFNSQFPNEYSIFGWFKWESTIMEQWHLAFRLHINKDEINKNDQILGDRTLAAWVSPQQDGIYAMATYSYQNLEGNGQPNIVQIIPQDQQETKWHFIFFSYNRITRIAGGYIKFQNKQESIHFDNINHFLVPQFYLNIGKDNFYKSWNGYIGKLTMNLCNGASKDTLNENFINPPIINPYQNIYVTQTMETCLVDTKIIEVTQINIRSIINTLQEEEIKEKVCFCSLMID